MKGWSVNHPLAILQSQNSDVVMMLNESICMQCSGTFSVAARCDRPQAQARRIDDPVDRFQVRNFAIEQHVHPTIPSYHTPNLAHTSPIPSPSFPFLLLLQFFEFLLFSLFGSFSLSQSLACILEGSWAKGNIRPVLTVNPTALLPIHSFVAFFEVIRLLTSLISPIPQFKLQRKCSIVVVRIP
jgi:hypothetical protein